MMTSDKHDRYQRLLAHAFTGDGENIQATLLKKGFARSAHSSTEHPVFLLL